MTFSDEYADLLTPFVENYKAAKNDKERKVVVRNAADALAESKNLQEDGEVDLPKDLPTAITRYIKGVIEKESNKEGESSKRRKGKQTYKIRDVIKQLYRDRIEDEIPVKQPHKDYIGHYQRALTTVQTNLSGDELKEAEAMLEEWCKEGLPRDVQLKNAKKKLPGDIKKKIEEWKFSSGALVMCLVAYPDGKDAQGFHVESSPIVGNSFTNSYKEWRDGTYENFKEWAIKQFGFEDLDSDDEAEVPVDAQKAKDIPFTMNKKGHIVVPNKSQYKRIRERQRVVRGYIGAVYRDFTGYQKAAFPYILASEEGQKIYSSDSVPDGFTLIDPDHLKGSEIDALYNHWITRQSKGLAPFIILNANPQHQVRKKKISEKSKGKKKADYVHVSTDDEDRETGGEVAGGEVETVEDDEEIDKLPPKFGPPGGRRKKIDLSNQINKIIEPEAGPSNKTSLEKVKKNSQGQAGKSGKSTSKAGPVGSEENEKKGRKRKKGTSKVEDKDEDATDLGDTSGKPTRKKAIAVKQTDGDEEPPTKRRRTRNEESNGDGSQKRKRQDEDQEESPPKRKRTVQDESKLPRSEKVQPVSSVEHQGRSGGRLKEFPAANVTTSSSRIAFLQRLCKIPKFLSLVDHVPRVPKPSAIPKDFPSWASWTSRENFLPATFHKPAAFKKILSIAKTALGDSSTFEDGKIDTVLLLVGLMYREVSRAMEIEPEEDDGSPEQLRNSKFGIQQMEKIESLIEAVVIPS